MPSWSYGVGLSPVNAFPEAERSSSRCLPVEGLGRRSLPWSHRGNERYSKRRGQNRPPRLRSSTKQLPSLPPGDGSLPVAFSLSTTSLYPPDKSESKNFLLYIHKFEVEFLTSLSVRWRRAGERRGEFEESGLFLNTSSLF